MSAFNYQNTFQTRHSCKGRRGFSAVELVAVSTIIAILSMILVQSLQNHVEKARLARVYTDLGEIRDIQSLIFAQTSRFARLQDLDNTEIYTSPSATADLDIEVPGLFYKMSMDDVLTTDLVNVDLAPAPYDRIRSIMSNKWTGPYTNFTEYMEMQDLVSDMNWLLSENGGPIYYDTSGGVVDVSSDRYPLDPWGNPYLFFPRYHIDDSAPTAQDVVIGGRVYSLGPDGFPGSNDGSDTGDPLESTDYFPGDTRSDGDLGEDGSDDILFEF